MKRTQFLAIIMAAVASVATAAGPAGAAIRCDGEFQINSQGEFSSLYCQEDNLAKVARSRGLEVTAAQIRASESVLQHVCLQIGGDISVTQICDRFLRHGRHCDLVMPC